MECDEIVGEFGDLEEVGLVGGVDLVEEMGWESVDDCVLECGFDALFSDYLLVIVDIVLGHLVLFEVFV